MIAYARKDWVQGGTFAELVTAPVRTVARKPKSLDWHQAAGLPLAGLTAYQLLARLGLKEGETVLVHAAAGGVGLFAVQIARALGARVIGTASEGNHEFLRGLGAEPVTYGDGLAERVRDLAPDGVDVVADFVGGVLDVTQAVLEDGGRHGSITDGTVAEAGGLSAWVRPNAEDLTALGDLADAGQADRPGGRGLCPRRCGQGVRAQPDRARPRQDRHRGQRLTGVRPERPEACEEARTGVRASSSSSDPDRARTGDLRRDRAAR